MFASPYRGCLAALTLAAGVAGCAGHETGSSDPIPVAIQPAVHQNHRGSWMKPEGKSQTLLYISDTVNHDVNVYTYPGLKYAGQRFGCRRFRRHRGYVDGFHHADHRRFQKPNGTDLYHEVGCRGVGRSHVRGIRVRPAQVGEPRDVEAARMSEASVVRWLLGGDPAIRWQVMRDLTNEPAGAVSIERARVADEGWGRALLDRQSAQGSWGGPNDEGWMITMDALALLREMGLDPSSGAARRAIARVKGLTWESLGNRPYFDGETEPCINGAILAFGSYFGERCDRIVDRLLSEQLADGGWNCEAPPSVRSSFNSTIRVLEGLFEYERAWGPDASITGSRLKAHDYLLERRMFRRLTNGEIVEREWTRFAFPTMWHYDVLRGLDYLRSARVEPDERVAEAIGIVESRRHQNGRWPMNHLHADRLGFPLETEIGRASRWNTLRAMRVLHWYYS